MAKGDHVCFGVVKRKLSAPLAVNVWRIRPEESGIREKKKRKKEKVEAAPQDEFNFASVGQSVPDKLQGEHTGIVKNQSVSSGHYFVECDAIFQEYGRDATIKSFDMPRGCGMNDAVTFQIQAPAGDLQAPRAYNIRKAARADAEAAFAAGFRKGKGKGGWGKDAGGFGGKGYAKGKWANRAPTNSMRMIGVVKQRSQHNGLHRVLCQDISDVYKRDALIGREEEIEGLKVGMRIAFNIEEPAEGSTGTPMAWNIKILGKAEAEKKKTGQAGGDGEDSDEEAAADDADAWGDEEDTGGGEEDLEVPAEEEEDPDACYEEPTTTEGWIKAQKRLFGTLPRLPKGWIRIRSKSKGLIYFYNVEDGRSQPNVPEA